MIDWHRVCELRDELGAEDFLDVVPLFLEEVGAAITDMPLMQTAQDLSAQFHFVKGASLNLGFSALADLCKKGEVAAAGGDMTAVAPADVATCFAASKAEFEAELQARLAA